MVSARESIAWPKGRLSLPPHNDLRIAPKQTAALPLHHLKAYKERETSTQWLKKKEVHHAITTHLYK